MSDSQYGKKKIQLSASSIKDLRDCTWYYYCKKVLRLPEVSHPKTRVGSICHKVLEILKNPRHYHHFETILDKTPSILNSTPIIRLINNLIRRYEIDEGFFDEIGKMIVLGLQTDFFHKDSLKVYPPEKKFTIETDKYQVVGYIDELAEYVDKYKIRDYKTQAKKFTKAQLEENIQACIYQLGIWLETGKLSSVEFVMLRHPPTAKKKDNHIQVVNPYSETELKGLQHYLDYIADYLKDFGEQKARSNFKADRKNEQGFCHYVCNFKNPFTYWALLDSEGNTVRTSFDKESLDLNMGDRIVKKFYSGCPRWN